MIDREKIAKSYNYAADAYLEARPAFDNSRYLEMVATHLEPGASILDLGCGAGVPADKALSEMGFSVHGIDISERQVELARQHVPGASFEVRDMSELRDGEYGVDAIVSLYAVYHIPRETHPELFKKLHSFLTDNGILFVLMGAKDWVGTKDSFYGVQMAWSMYGPDANRELIEKAGFQIIVDEIDTAGGERHQAIIAKKLPTIIQD